MIERPITVPEPHSSPYRYLENLGFFDGTKSTLVHAVHVSPEELRDIAQRDIGVVLCPRSNFFLKVGEPPVRHIARLKRVGIGTDGLSSNYNLDMLEEMRFLHLISAKRLNQDAAYFTVYAATLGGARALFIEDRTGSIEVGKEADLIFLDTLFPSKDPYHSVISSDRGDVKLVMVRGEIIYSRKQHRKSSA
ncbi:MAG: amidohydrolase family protein [Candidatus Dadabacteria bacterium]|nr:amidohydrolase family protein [Candidatus Dadabacteria bacterium]